MIIEIKKEQSRLNGGTWIDVKNGAEGSLWAQILVFPEGSEYGYRGGRISKIHVCKANNGKRIPGEIYTWDRGHKDGKYADVRDFVEEIIRKYNR